MTAYDILRRKRDGLELGERELRFFISGCVSGHIPDYQIAAMLMAIVLRGMTVDETVILTRCMIESGCVLDFEDIGAAAVDKHSTGGVGDKTSIALVPLATECGLFVPMISGRSLGHTGGTLDKLESIPGLRTELETEEILSQVRALGGCFGAQTKDFVPADRVLYSLRDATATVESLPLIVSSILSKKLAEGISGVVIDVKCGRGAFMETESQARELAKLLEAVGYRLGCRVKTLVTNMDEPLGRAVGNALEVAEAIDILQGSGPPDSTALVLRLAAEMIVLGGKADSIEEGEKAAREAIESGRAIERFEKIIFSQGGRLDLSSAGLGLPSAPRKIVLESATAGWITRVDARAVGEVVRALGGGRWCLGDAVDHAVGVIVLHKSGEKIGAGEPLFEIHAGNSFSAEDISKRLLSAVEFSDSPTTKTELFVAG